MTRARRPRRADAIGRLFRLGPRPRIRERDIGAPPGERFGDDEADPLAAGDQCDGVREIHSASFYHEVTKVHDGHEIQLVQRVFMIFVNLRVFVSS